MTHLSKGIACALCALATVSASAVFATDSALDTYEQIIASQGQEGYISLDSIGEALLPDDVTLPTFSESDLIATQISSSGTSGTTTDTSSSGTTSGTTTDTSSSDTTSGTTTDTSSSDTTTSSDTSWGNTNNSGTASDTTWDNTGTTTGTTTTDTTTTTTTTTTTPTVTEPTYTTVEVSLTQSYNSTYSLYELSASDRYYVYTNIENGGISSGSFFLDIPYNITYTVAKDGLESEYTRKSDITELGSYLFTFIFTDETKLIQYVSTFRFRIEPAVVDDTVDTSSQVTVIDPADYPDDIWDMEAIDPTTMTEEELALWLESEEDPTLLLDPEALLEEDLLSDLETEASQDAMRALTCTYDTDVSYYVNTLITGDYFYSNVPNGMTTNGSVRIQAGEGDLTFTLYRNGTAVDFAVGASVSDTGTYLLYPSKESAIYWAAYSDVSAPVFAFTILGDTPSNQRAVFSVPETMYVSLVTLNGETIDVETIHNNNLYLPEDGLYELTLEGIPNAQVLTFERDTTAPTFTVDTSQSNQANITYHDTELSKCLVYFNGVEQSDNILVSQVTEPGDYTIEVYDAAGNTSSQSFSVEYALNSAALIAIVLVVVVAIGSVFVLRRFRTKVTVR